VIADAEQSETGRADEAHRPVAQAVDSSVSLAAIIADDPQHEAAELALADSSHTIAHVAVETYSVLTRIHPPLRLDADTAAMVVEKRLPSERVTLDATQHASAIRRLADARISGGATYDGLIALTALEHDIELVSRDHRAARTYRALGVRFRLLV
jgi:predicted nucleic acid-binding protein